MPVGLHGSKALRKTVLDVLDRPVIQRCRQHNIRNVKDHLPQRLRGGIGRNMTEAYHGGSALQAEAALLGRGQRTRPHPSVGGREPARGPRGHA